MALVQCACPGALCVDGRRCFRQKCNGALHGQTRGVRKERKKFEAAESQSAHGALEAKLPVARLASIACFKTCTRRSAGVDCVIYIACIEACGFTRVCLVPVALREGGGCIKRKRAEKFTTGPCGVVLFAPFVLPPCPHPQSSLDSSILKAD